MIPRDILFVSESGIRNAQDVEKLRQVGADAVLIGETLMRAENKERNPQNYEVLYDKNKILRSILYERC